MYYEHPKPAAVSCRKP